MVGWSWLFPPFNWHFQARTLEAAIAAVEAAPQSPALIFAAAEGWHPGVIGIVAARLKERYERPACVVALADGIGKGSGRSVRGGGNMIIMRTWHRACF